MKFAITTFGDHKITGDADLKRSLLEFVSTLCEQDAEIKKFFDVSERKGQIPQAIPSMRSIEPRRKGQLDEIGALDELKSLNNRMNIQPHGSISPKESSTAFRNSSPMGEQNVQTKSNKDLAELPQANALMKQLQKFRAAKYATNQRALSNQRNKSVILGTERDRETDRKTERVETPTMMFMDNLPRIQRTGANKGTHKLKKNSSQRETSLNPINKPDMQF